MDDDATSSFADHRLSGFLYAVLAVTSPYPPNNNLLPFGTRFRISPDSSVSFRSQNDAVVLSPVAENPVVECERRTRTRKRSIGLVNGSISVVHQLHALVMNKCVKIDAFLLRVEVEPTGDGEVRAVLLVDVYLPIQLWSGWQFPKLGSVAGSLFRHLSSDWAERSALLADKDYLENNLGGGRNIWNLSDCHVFGCKRHHNFTDSSKKKLFELHEIFKSLPTMAETGNPNSSRIQPVDDSCEAGIWDISDDILLNILATLNPVDLVRVSATCCHLRSLAVSSMPCMKLKLFPHQRIAVEWMLQREKKAKVLPHPLYLAFSTEDEFSFCINTISGEIVTGEAPTISDFHGGMFCDEPGLGKTITALSLILKTQGTLATPPDGVQVNWCTHNGDQRCGYYELDGDNVGVTSMLPKKRDMGTDHNGLDDSKYCRSKRARLLLDERIPGFSNSCPGKVMKTPAASDSGVCAVRCTRSLGGIKKDLLPSFQGASGSKQAKAGKNLGRLSNDNWVQCDVCRKWRKLPESSIADASAPWFCSMNSDPFYQSCSVPEESWDNCEPITHLLGFHTKGTAGGEEQNVSFFISVLKERYALINSITKKALSWLAKLSSDQVSVMETIGLRSPFVSSCVELGDAFLFQELFQAFGLKRRVEKGVIKWCYPQSLNNMSFDVAALRIALSAPLNSVRLYLSRATLIVVPSNLVDHWATQIQKHVRPGQLRVYVWSDHKKPSAHSLAWDYDVIITTFNRLSAEWGPRKKSALMQVHWLRVMLDEGHTLGSSLSLTNKMQMAVSLMASNRWILTGTPTPNTPNSQLSHLQPLLKFLHEESYGQNYKSWEAGILRPFEAKMEEGRSRLLHLLHRCMISARKMDMQTIPPCIKKATFLDFAEQHARSYNELVETVRRNILLADWNDPSHVESLLNPKQWKFRSTTIKNVRLSCCVAGHIKVTDAGEDIQETMDILVQKGLDPMSEEYALIRYNISYGGNCVRCKEWCRLPVITPCKHLLCLDCVGLDSERCTYPGCGNLYEMQTPDTLTRPENPNPKWPVPKDLIELQPSYKQDDWDPDWQSTSSSKVSYLVRRLKALQESNSKVDCPTNVKNSAMDTNNLISLSEMGDSRELIQVHGFRWGAMTHETNLDKVLVFSQFLEHIHVIEQQLTIAGIKYAGMYSPMHSSNKMKSLASFQNDASCIVLLMDGSAALGLDLSFVTHVFLMEPIWDRSMEEQVISRAHRMGATRPVHVETLAMRGTIEEQMLEFLHDSDECRRVLKEETGKSDQGARTQRSLHDFADRNYLSHLSFVRTSAQM
ncbi:PREDICTED: F-box protein At3g54460 [Fragaria vesca subsp. vesca]|uniref:F-box protein At3g54460 n=1 Tax=Fragaria vesca subsp. vesca TaxID=101020 RepID=UPI0002C36325|nr:PREDICTED: F-box protein At3g54460 [Fragaria vesca subsp. vesca]